MNDRQTLPAGERVDGQMKQFIRAVDKLLVRAMDLVGEGRRDPVWCKATIEKREQAAADAAHLERLRIEYARAAGRPV